LVISLTKSIKSLKGSAGAPQIEEDEQSDIGVYDANEKEPKNPPNIMVYHTI
jgi:glutaredoxin